MEEEELVDYSKEVEEVFLKSVSGSRDEVLDLLQKTKPYLCLIVIRATKFMAA